MTTQTARMIGGIGSGVMAALAVLALIYAAGAKLATIETELIGVRRRLTSIESLLIASRREQRYSDAAGRSGRVARPAGLLDAVAGSEFLSPAMLDYLSGKNGLPCDGSEAE